jgi:acetylornithine deacetylase/succinyl-diaminopimelate desuccinylase-like protein
MDDRVAIEALLRRICEVPAPTSEEGERATLVAALFREAGLAVERDAVGNVIAETVGGVGPRVLAAAHLDTVFPADTDVAVRREGERLAAPGIGDNSASLAVMLRYAGALAAGAKAPRVTLAATVGEEGEGDLRGARRLVADRGDETDLFIAIDGHLGTVVDSAVGSRRFRVAFFAQGGHAWGDYPAPSAVHALGEAVYGLARLSPPREPRSSLNVGQVWGGTSINAIAERSGFNLDLRSLDAATLDGLVREAESVVRRSARRHRVRVEIEQIGDRPAARVVNRELVGAARAALTSVGVNTRRAASSTDANAAMAVGIPSIAFGVYRGGDSHRLSEWLDPTTLPVGYRALTELMRQLAATSG